MKSLKIWYLYSNVRSILFNDSYLWNLSYLYQELYFALPDSQTGRVLTEVGNLCLGYTTSGGSHIMKGFSASSHSCHVGGNAGVYPEKSGTQVHAHQLNFWIIMSIVIFQWSHFTHLGYYHQGHRNQVMFACMCELIQKAHFLVTMLHQGQQKKRNCKIIN